MHYFDTHRLCDNLLVRIVFLSSLFDCEVKTKNIVNLIYVRFRGKTTKENIRKMNYDEGILDERKQMVNWCKTDPSLFDSKCVLTDEQIEIIKQKWAGEPSNHKSSASF